MGGTVIQGCFPNGFARLQAPAGVAQPSFAQPQVRPQWVQNAIAAPAVQMRAAQPQVANPRLPAPPPPAPRPPASPIQRLANGSAIRFNGTLPPPVAAQPLPPAVLQKMEAAFNTSFRDVRVRVGGEAPAIGALAFTHGSTIYFAPGQYNPQIPHGERLLAHELAHVVQQRSGRARNPFGAGIAVVDDHALEAEAQWMSHRAAALAVAQLSKRKSKFGRPDSDESSGDGGGDDSGDGDFFIPERKTKVKKPDPKSKINYKTRKQTGNKLEYSTVGRSKHEESYDDTTGIRITITKSLTIPGPDYRNDTKRPNDHKVYNHYGLSKGQSTNNQLVVSHSTPSWLGMGAGGDYGNYHMTSKPYNSNVEKAEKKWRKEIEGGGSTVPTAPFEYRTETTTVPLKNIIDDDESIEEMVGNSNHPHWTKKERVKKRLKEFLKKNPTARVVKSEKRTLTGSNKRKRTKTFEFDSHFGLPGRAYNKDVNKKYVDARGGDSEESDNELDPNPPKKKRKKDQG